MINIYTDKVLDDEQIIGMTNLKEILVIRPESFLHPEQQIKWAENIIETANSSNISIFSTSPYIIEAFIVYSRQHNTKIKVSINTKDGIKESFGDHTYEAIFSSLSTPFDTLEWAEFGLKK